MTPSQIHLLCNALEIVHDDGKHSDDQLFEACLSAIAEREKREADMIALALMREEARLTDHTPAPSDVGELVRRLIFYAKHDGHSSDAEVALCSAAQEAASLIQSQAARIAELEAGMEPFAVRAGMLDGKWLDHETQWSPAYGSTEITIGDLRRACSLLSKERKG